jgi:hypothetical protein
MQKLDVQIETLIFRNGVMQWCNPSPGFCIYLPQFHAIPEDDARWENGSATWGVISFALSYIGV